MEKKKVPKNNPKPRPWFLGWGLAKFAGQSAAARKKEMKEKMERAKK